MDDDNNNEIASSLSLISQLPDIELNGTYWIVKAPTHGENQPDVIGFDEQFNYLYAEKGQIYCGNCQKYDFYDNIKSTIKCKKCDVSFKSVQWFSKVTYTIEINNVIFKSLISYDEAIQHAKNNRSSKNNIYVYYVKQDIN